MTTLSFITINFKFNIDITKTKKCTKCEIEKRISEFYQSVRGKYGVKSGCIECSKQYYVLNKNKIKKRQHKYYIDNKAEINKQHKKYYNNNINKEKARRKIYYKKNKEKLTKYSKEYKKINKEKCIEWDKNYRTIAKRQKYLKQYRSSNREKTNKYVKLRRENDGLLRTCINLSKRLRHQLNNIGDNKNNQHVFEILNYSKKDFFDRINKYIDKPCERCDKIIITLQNSEIDHIIASSFAKTKEETIQLNHYTNLRLICSECNKKKKNKLDFDSAILPDFADFYINRKLKENK